MAARSHTLESEGAARDDAAWHDSLIVLDTSGHDALVYNPSNRYTPFIVASYFDPEDKTWSHGSYYGDLVSAACSLHGLPHPDHAIGGFTPMSIAIAARDRIIDQEVAEMAASKLNQMLGTALAHSMESLVDCGLVELAVMEAEEECRAPFEEADLDALASEKTAESEAVDPGIRDDRELDTR